MLKDLALAQQEFEKAIARATYRYEREVTDAQRILQRKLLCITTGVSEEEMFPPGEQLPLLDEAS